MGFPWTEVLTIGVPALVSLGSAGIAVREANRARLSEQEAERLRVAEERAAEHKFEVYEPIIESFRRMFEGQPPEVATWNRFWTWISIYGSEQSVRAFGRLMQCTFDQPSPPHVLVRSIADFILEARRDIGDSRTDLDAVALMMPKINDLFDDRAYYLALTLPLDELYARCQWIPPWKRSEGDMHNADQKLTAWRSEDASP